MSRRLTLPEAFTLRYAEVEQDARAPWLRTAEGAAAIHERAPLASLGFGPVGEARERAAGIERPWPARSFNVTFCRSGPELFLRIEGPEHDEIVLYDGVWTYDYDEVSPRQGAVGTSDRRFSRASASPCLNIEPAVFPLAAGGLPDLPLMRDIRWVTNGRESGVAVGRSPILGTGGGRYGPEFAPSTLVFALDGGHVRPVDCRLRGRDGRTLQEWLFGPETALGDLSVADRMIFVQYDGDDALMTRTFRLTFLSQQPVPAPWLRPETWLDTGADVQIDLREGSRTIMFNPADGPLRTQVERGRRKIEAAATGAERDAAHGNVFKGIFAVITIALMLSWVRRRRLRGSK